ncbi:hypothetical protein EP7_004076 [Isosphaeraceae bacterium EP7]
MMQREMYHSGMSKAAVFSHPDHIRVQKPIADNGKYLRPSCGSDFSESADDEFNGDAWLKQQGASITISIGEFDDSDVTLDSKASLEAAIEQISAKLEKQRAA